ncbi:MAG: molybdopterin-dependent oxidoreductase [Anaerolineae bacterium]|nr:molybdopterin-dependent oxidoreductase [Anaerolineae bacterium]
MKISFSLNGKALTLDAAPNESLLRLLRRYGVFGVKYGDGLGMSGADVVLLDGAPVVSSLILAAQAAGRSVVTIEGLGGAQERGWRGSEPLHPLQVAFVETGAIQCGYCTPAMILAAKALLDRNPDPTEDDVRAALAGVLCRCTGYVKPVEAVLRAAAMLRGEEVPPIGPERAIPVPAEVFTRPAEWDDDVRPSADAPQGQPGTPQVTTRTLPVMLVAPEVDTLQQVGKPAHKVDARKLVQGNPAFTDDIEFRGMLVGKLLLSPHAHALIRRIDASRARALPGVHAVLTHQDLPRVPYTTAGQSDPEPGPHDNYSLDYKVRFVGDRVAAVAAETEEIALRALALIEVEYELLPAIFDPRESMKEGAPILHNEPESWHIEDRTRNLAAVVDWEVGNVEEGFAQADRIFEAVYYSPKVQQTPLEPHVVVTWWDEDDRLVIRTSTQVPFHARRILAPVLGLPEKRIRVIKPRIGGGFGVKQEVLLEDICAHLTIATGRPVRLEYTREEEFYASRSRHPMYLTLKTGVTRDGMIVANQMHALSDTGACGAHAMTVAGNTGHKGMSLYNAPNIKFRADVVYTNTPPSGAYRGYGVPQGFWAVEQQMEWIAREMGWDPLEFRLNNAIKSGDEHPASKAWSEGREAAPEFIQSCGLAECVEQGAKAIRWHERFDNPAWHQVPGKPHLRRGIGVAAVMQGTAIPRLDMGAASIKINDDGSFNLLVGATDLGTGSDTVLTQMAAEVLGCAPEDFITYSSDTDFTPFDKGAYASSTTYISGRATVLAAEKVAAQMCEVAARMLSQQDESAPPVAPADITLRDRAAHAPDGRSVTHREIALNSLHHEHQQQIMATASYVSPDSPPPFAAQYVTVTLDTETGQFTVDEMVMAVDGGVIVNPVTASGQVEGGMVQALGYGHCEEMAFDAQGRMTNPQFGPYKIYRADEMPEMGVIFIETYEPSGPFGAKAVAEIPLDGAGPALANALYDAAGIRMTHGPLLPERVWRALRQQAQAG